MSLQDVVKGDRVAYLVKRTAGYEACCGTVLQVGFLNLKPFKLFMSAVVVSDDSGEVNVVHKHRLDFLDGYTGNPSEVDCDEVVAYREEGRLPELPPPPTPYVPGVPFVAFSGVGRALGGMVRKGEW